MKKITNYSKMLMLICILCIANAGRAQAPCSASLTLYSGINGNFTFNGYAASTNTTMANPVVWNFGNGTVITGTNNFYITNQYTVNGTYTVTMTYTSLASSCSASVMTVVNVTNANGCNLIPNFGYTPASGGTINFNANASQYTTPGATYTWVFGDGSTNGSGQSTSHSYATTGVSYPVKLIVNNNTTPTCKDSVTYNVFVCGVSAIITSTPGTNGAVNFSTTATGTGTFVNYNWNFGGGINGYSGPNASPTHTYLANGNYTVSALLSTGQCSTTLTHTLSVNNVTSPCGLSAGFYGNVQAGGNVIFYNYTSGAAPGVTYLWSFADGTTSTATAPTHNYALNGAYIVTLTANNNFSYTCASTTTVIIGVATNCSITPGFNATVGANGGVTFANTTTGTSGGTTTYVWGFGDGTTSASTSPNHTYANGVYNVTLTATKTNGTLSSCSNSTIQVVTVTTCVADASFSMTPAGTPQFWNAYPLAPGNVTAASWDWGDNSTSGTLYTAHTYSAAGIYSICLTVTVNCGSVNSYCMPYSIYKSSGSQEIIQVTVIDPATVGIRNNIVETDHIVISPNPNSGSFVLNLPGSGSGTTNIRIYNVVGKLVYQSETPSENGMISKEVRLNEVANGVYFVKINDGNKELTKKVIINKQ